MEKLIYAVTRTGTRDIVHISGTLICSTGENTPSDLWIRANAVYKFGGVLEDYSIFRLTNQYIIEDINRGCPYEIEWTPDNQMIAVLITGEPPVQPETDPNPMTGAP